MNTIKKISIIMTAAVVLSGCLSESKIVIDDELDSKIFFSTDRMTYQDNIIINDDIVTIHYPDYYESFDNYSDIKVVFKSFDILNGTKEYLDNNPSSLCNKDKVEECSSYLTGFTSGLFRSDKNLYFSTTSSTSKVSYKETFVKTDLDGSNMVVIYEYPIADQFSGTVEYVVLDHKVFYSFFDSNIFMYDEINETNEVILESDKDNYGFYDFMSLDKLTFRAESFKDLETGDVYKDAFVSYEDGKFVILNTNVDFFTKLIVTESYSIETENSESNELLVNYTQGEQEVLSTDFKYFTPGGYIVSKDYIILNYVVNNDERSIRTVLYKFHNDRLLKIDEKNHDEEVQLNMLYKNLLVYSYTYSHPKYGNILFPMYTTIDDQGFSDFTVIDEYK